MAGIADPEIIRKTRFLIVDGDKAALATIEQYLKALGSPQVVAASAPLVALRTLQDPRARIDCLICAHKRGTITGLQFLQGLRSGRWGPGRVQNVKFMLMMPTLDVPAVQVADRSGVSGYYIGELQQIPFAVEVIKMLSAERGLSPLPAMQVAHVNFGGADFIFVPFDPSFAHADPGAQQRAVIQVQNLMQEQMLGGDVTPVWETPNTGLGYFAAPHHHQRLAGLTMDFVKTNLNRELTMVQPPAFAVLSSPGSAAYAAMMAGGGHTPGADDVLYLKGFEAEQRGVNGGVS